MACVVAMVRIQWSGMMGMGAYRWSGFAGGRGGRGLLAGLLGAGLGFTAEQVFAQGGGFPGAAGFRFGFGAWGCMGELVRHGARKQQGRG